ncbi:MAG: SNF2-related protein [Polyangia bacterium]
MPPSAIAVAPPAPPLAAVPLQVEPLALSALAELLERPPSPPSLVAHVLRAHTLSALQQFEELLSLRSLHGVDAHTYQIETVRRVLRVLGGRALLADEVGLGKTIEALMVLREYQLRGLARRVLILSPAPLVPHWVGELESKAGLSCRTPDDAAFAHDPAQFWKSDGLIVASLALARTARHAPLVQAAPWDLLIVDEAHRLKNRSTLGWKLVDGCKSRFLLLVTATPIENDLEELYNLVTLLKPGQFATAAAFRKQFVDSKHPTSPKNRERLRTLLSEVMVRNTRAQSGLKLPPRFVTTVVVHPDAGEKALYERTLELLRAHAEEPSARLAAATLLLEAGSSAHALRGTLERMLAGTKHGAAFRESLAALRTAARSVEDSKKGQALLDLLLAHPKEQLLLFTRYRDTLRFLDDLLTQHHVPHAVFHGGLDGAAKQAALTRFRDGTRVLLATDAGGEGQNLQFCHLLCNFDLPWNPMVIEQRIGRLHRMGQTEEVRVYNLCARGTVEERLLDVLDRRLHLFELVVGEMDMVLGNLSDERDLEDRVLDLYAQARSESEIEAGLDTLTEELRAARLRYERTRAFDEALFGKDYAA